MKRCFDRSFYYWTRDKQGKVGRLFRARRKPRYLLKEGSVNLGNDISVIYPLADVNTSRDVLTLYNAKLISVEEVKRMYGVEI